MEVYIDGVRYVPAEEQEPNAPSIMLSLREVAERLGVSEATLRWWRHEGTGPKGFKLGRHIRFLEDEVNAWLERRQEESR